MKGDFTRDSFDPKKHFQQVLMQQGRVQLDADWNEQAAIAMRRHETTVEDIVGSCGGPEDNAAFRIITDKKELEALKLEAKGTPFALSAGRYYVHGRQCEVEAPFSFLHQPDHVEKELSEGDYLIYLDVWQRHITMLEDGSLRESALGGPDTATRVKTVWQVRAAALDAKLDPDLTTPSLCHLAAKDFDKETRLALPEMAARTTKATADSEPCTIPASAGYRGLENQLYRVEIHDPGAIGTATFKWSRENGSIITRITDGKNLPNLIVASTGPDANLGLQEGDIVEVIHDSDELAGRPGGLAKIGEMVDPSMGKIKLQQLGSEPMPGTINSDSNPRLRRWENYEKVAVDAAVNEGFLPIENGIEIKFHLPTNAEFRTGDYWQIPARAAISNAPSGLIEWPVQENLAAFCPLQGIVHSYCRLGVVSIDKDGDAELISDCRCLWPALSTVPRLFYVSGDGQEVMPDLQKGASKHTKLPCPLMVGVANGQCIEGLKSVRFDVVNTVSNPSEGLVVVAGGTPTQSFEIVQLDAVGLAKVDFYLDATNPVQQVVARLLDLQSNPVSLPLIFNAQLSVASQVAYQPGSCAGLSGRVTVQDAIDRLAEQIRIYKVSGDAQSTAGGQPLPEPIVVLVANQCGPVPSVPVTFKVLSGGGSVKPTEPTLTDANGRADCQWILGGSSATQELQATMVDKVGLSAAPMDVRFTARVLSGDAAQPSVRIKGVFRLPGPLRLGSNIPVSELGTGLRIDCDHDIDKATVEDPNLKRGEPTCFVTVEVPLPLTQDQIRFWGDTGLVGYTPIVLAANVVVNGNQISWTPSPEAISGLTKAFNAMNQFQGRLGERILARLTLKGNFIWATSSGRENKLYLDGEAVRFDPTDESGTGKEFGVRLPSGDGRRGGDFEMWFWLTRG